MTQKQMDNLSFIERAKLPTPGFFFEGKSLEFGVWGLEFGVVEG